jgi:hypothetical protein
MNMKTNFELHRRRGISWLGDWLCAQSLNGHCDALLATFEQFSEEELAVEALNHGQLKLTLTGDQTDFSRISKYYIN